MDLYRFLLTMDDTSGQGGQHPETWDSSRTHISSYFLALSLRSCSGDLESACRCRLRRPSATMSAPPLGTSQVWKAERGRGGLIFHASLHDEKLRGARGGGNASSEESLH